MSYQYQDLCNGRFYLGDNVKVMRDIPDNVIDLTVTSPPYDNLREYSGESEWGWEKFTQLAKELYRVTKDGGVVVWNVADQTVNGGETGNSFRQALYFIDECGFKLHDTMIYQKAQAFGGSKFAYLHCFEYVFVLKRGTNIKTFNPIRDRLNKRGGVTESTAKAGMRKNGTIPDRHEKTAAFAGKRKNIWEYGVGGGNTGHPAVFPINFARDHITSWSNEGDLVLDPFMGSGTTACACVETNRKWVGIEIAQDYADLAINRIENHITKKQGNEVPADILEKAMENDDE